ncbi:CDP-alcohol phosphatidyltransferase family protein [Methylobacterium crusticola]|uniref:CDP-alcohol phosphatidyltransferase family protein n=1 Tax=Methylobacterium crusticola TaxID=1697972 RepID=UPI0034D46819
MGLLFTSFTLMFNHPWLPVAFYLANVTLDEFDGRGARKYNQCTKFGGMLDIVVHT